MLHDESTPPRATAKSSVRVKQGYTDVIQEDADGARRTLARLGPGEFFGELAIVHRKPRTAHIVAVEDVTCLVFAPGEPSAFAGRGADARLLEIGTTDGVTEEHA